MASPTAPRRTAGSSTHTRSTSRISPSYVGASINSRKTHSLASLRDGKGTEPIRRLKHPRANDTGTIVEARQRWLPIDFDWPNEDHEDDPFPVDTIDPTRDPDAAIAWVIERIAQHRPEFRGASFRWQFTTKTGIRRLDGTLYKPGIYFACTSRWTGQS